MGGSGSTQSTQQNQLPGYAKAYAQNLTTNAQNLYNSGLPQQQVAPFTQNQLEAQQQAAALSAPGSATNNALSTAQNANTAIASGANLNPATNPYLQQYANAAALPMIQQYEQSVAPNILSNAVASGGLGSSGSEQAFQNAQSSLAQGLGNLYSGIYEPAYETGLGQQASAIGQAPTLAEGQYIPSTELGQVGQQQQTQAQNVLSTLFGNQMAPYNAISTQAGLISPLSGGQSLSFSTTPNLQQTK